MSVDFYNDYQSLQDQPLSIFVMSEPLRREILVGGLDRYIDLYQYFWKLIENNRQFCVDCHEKTCYNRYFYLQLQKDQLTENDLYILMYIVFYFLDLLNGVCHNLAYSYYVLSKGHDHVMNYLIKKPECQKPDFRQWENYRGYFSSVLYYLLNDFKYVIPTK